VRLNLDLDYCSQLMLLKAYLSLARFTNKLELFISSVNNGKENYHLVAYDLPDVDEKTFYELRRTLNDDPVRVWLDESLHGKPEQVLFNRRVPMSTRKPRWRWRLHSILWKPWISRLPAKKPNRR